MKVYFIGQKGMPAKFGGVEAHVEDLSKRLVQLGHEANVYTRPNYTDPKLKEFAGVNLISLPNLASKHLDAISATFRAIWDLRKREVDVIHFHSIGPSSLLPLAKIIKPGVPIVATFHTRCYQHQKWGFFARTYLKFGELMLNVFADKVITISESLNKYAQEKYHSNPVYAPNGVNLPQRLEANQIKQWGLDKGNYIVTVSRLVRHKGIAYLIKAYLATKTDKKLVIVGSAAFTDDYVVELRALAKGNKNIIFTGNQSGEVLSELYSNAYLFVQPSESEGLSIALLEAMSYEKACLVSDIPENLEAIKNTGFTFENKNFIDLAKQLDHLLKRPALVYEMGILAHQRVAKFYNWQDISKTVVKTYAQAISKKHSKNFSRAINKMVTKFVGFIF